MFSFLFNCHYQVLLLFFLIDSQFMQLGMQRSEAALRSKEEELLQDSKTPRL